MPYSAQSQPMSVTLAQASHLLVSFTHFLTVAIHNVLFYRNLYPATTFLTTRVYNLPVHQSRHPKVCSWIRDAVDAIKAQLVQGSVQRIAIVVHGPDAAVLERWMIDVAAFPAFTGVKEPRGNRRDEEDDGLGAPEARDGNREGGINWTNVDEAFRGAVRRMAFAGEKMGPLPGGCSFTIAVELREDGEPPIGYPQHWIPTERNLQTQSSQRPEAGEDVGGAKTTPLRSVEAGPLFFECWVEEGKAKYEPAVSSASS
ncbi:uncharacterized protein JN550_000916 [Neoarthrinium moseri]|uniref:uncharacterized protein n=1 Tax=Neoarthrinium moseri TaxID=1658444 RepID=UPI001FDBAB47|nr:uncharacterized protein JN550_000916 [Neoarthrinium moseri]KAI1876844.1 hypothetical protein JN550_000916 [Neoarthrinium moseri]